MVDLDAVKKGLTGIIGLYPGFGQSFDVIDNSHSNPEMFLSDAHPILRPEILRDLGPNLTTINPPAFGQVNKYPKYYDVSDNGKVYESLVSDNTAPLNDLTKWKETTKLSAWYSRIERGSIGKLSLLLSAAPQGPTLLENAQTFQGEGNASDTINKQRRFVGWKVVIRGDGTAFNILRLGLQVTGPITNLPIYVFHSDSDQPIGTVNLTGTSIGRTVWADVSLTLYQRTAGYYLVGYYEDSLPANVYAVGSKRSFTYEDCSGCDAGVSRNLYEARAPYVSFTPFYIADINTDPGVLSWTENDLLQTGSQSWGLNMIMSARCDATPAILQNKALMTQALLYMIACDVLAEMSTNTRVNGTVENLSSQCYIILKGSAQAGNKDNGLTGERDTAIKNLKDALAAISPCTPVERKRGPRITSFWGD